MMEIVVSGICPIIRSFSFLILIFCFSLQSCSNNNHKRDKTTDFLPVVDLTKEYPEMEFTTDDDDKEFVPLETSDQVLADRYFSVRYLSEQRIVGVNSQQGDIFIFGRDGKIISFFNHKGQSNREYVYLTYLVFDEKNREFFIVDASKNQCLIYSDNGKFLRQFNFPDGTSTGALLDFDDLTLLAYNSYYEGRVTDEINNKMPYMFLSKKDGSIVSRLDLSFHERQSNMIKVGDRSFPIELPLGRSNMVKFGREIIIADNSTDTVYQLTQDKKLTPLFVRKPSYINDNKVVMMSIHYKTESYLFFFTMTDDLNEMVKMFSGGGGSRTLPPIRMLAFDLKTGQTVKVKGNLIANCVDVHGKARVNWTDAPSLLERLKNGKLEGKLKLVVQKLNEDDNPVVEIAKNR